MRRFTVTGTCIPEKNYMVDITEKLDQIIGMIELGQYFTINRARQYGKTTTLSLLYRRLKDQYMVLRLSFEGTGAAAFSSDQAFVFYFMQKTANFMKFLNVPDTLVGEWGDFSGYMPGEDAFGFLGGRITELCRKSEKEIILMIDEVDKSSDNQIFLNFLGLLRSKYLESLEGMDFTFKSVILSGIYDIKNLKLKLRPEEEVRYNSPWNIAADFNVDLGFSPEEIATMLAEYEKDHHTGMDIGIVSRELFFYTGGYPFLVSRLCKWLDEEGDGSWTAESVRNAETAVLASENTLFDDLIKNVENDPELKRVVRDLLLEGLDIPFVQSNETIKKGVMFGIFSSKGSKIRISNIIFETYLYNHFLIENLLGKPAPVNEQPGFVSGGKLNMPRILEKFRELVLKERG